MCWEDFGGGGGGALFYRILNSFLYSFPVFLEERKKEHFQFYDLISLIGAGRKQC